MYRERNKESIKDLEKKNKDLEKIEDLEEINFIRRLHDKDYKPQTPNQKLYVWRLSYMS